MCRRILLALLLLIGLQRADAQVPNTWSPVANSGNGVPGGSSGQVQYNNAGAFGGLATTGTGNAVLATSPTLVTPSVTGAFGTQVTAPTFGTSTNCASGASPAVCGSAASGSAAVPTGANPTLVVDTSAVTANSIILLTPDESLGTKLGVTCNTTITTQGPIVVTARSTGVSFTVEIDATVATNPTCFNYSIIN